MNIAMLCPGPSLAKTYHAEKYDAVIGVNRAYAFAACDWLACFDEKLLRELDDGNALVFTRAYNQKNPDCGISLEQVRGNYPTVKLSDAGMFTACGTLLLAAYLGAKHIYCYGCDWKDSPDWDGISTEGAWREHERWRREMQIWGHICGELSLGGVTVHRML